MNRTDRVWSHFDAAFAKFHEGFAEANKGFAEAERVADNTTQTHVNGERAKAGTVHEIQFNTRNWRERLRLVVKFSNMAYAVLFTGKTKLKLKER